MLIAAQKRIPPGTEPVFAPPDMLRKEAAIRDHTLGYRPPTHRQAPVAAATVPAAPSAPKFRPPPSLPPKPHTPILDRCVIAYPDPNAASIRPYMTKATIGTCNHAFTWGQPYKPARGMQFPPQSTKVVYYAWAK